MQEVLHNAEKHSQAGTLMVLVEPAKDFFIICVEDNGLGFTEQNTNNGVQNRGMRGVKDRVREIGATVSWQKSISYETGTLVTITVPRS